MPPYAAAIQPPEEYRGYLSALWGFQQARYALMWQLYTGEAWLEVDARKRDRDGGAPRKYRLGTNDIALACNMHAQLLFGEVKDNSDPLVSTRTRLPGCTTRRAAVQRTCMHTAVELANNTVRPQLKSGTARRSS